MGKEMNGCETYIVSYYSANAVQRACHTHVCFEFVVCYTATVMGSLRDLCSDIIESKQKLKTSSWKRFLAALSSGTRPMSMLAEVSGRKCSGMRLHVPTHLRILTRTSEWPRNAHLPTMTCSDYNPINCLL
jgi:hypothetical protein